MKPTRIVSILAGLLLTGIVEGQAPQSFNYQAVVRDNTGSAITSRSVSLRISILKGVAGTAQYVETHTSTTNEFGLIVLEIGQGTIVSGDFSTISWGDDTYFLKTELDPDGGTSYTDMGQVQLLSVPYALYAMNVENPDDADPDPSNELQKLSLVDDTLYLSEGGKVDLGYLDNELQTLSLASDTLYLSNGGKVYLGYLDNNTDEQNLMINEFYLSITDGNEILIPSRWELLGTSLFYNDGKVSIGGSENGIQLELPDLFLPGGKNLMVGDDAYLSDVDKTNTLGIYGATDSTTGAIQLGSEGPLMTGKANNLIVSGEIESTSGGIRFPDSTIQSTAMENQMLSISNDTLFLSDGGYVVVDPDTSNETQTMQDVLQEGNDAGYQAVNNLMIGQCEVCDTTTRGCMRFDTVSGRLQYCDGEKWQIILSTSQSLPTGGIFVSPMGADTAGAGSMYAPCWSIGFGISEAISQGYTKLFIANGTYNETIHVSNGVSLYGGYNPETWTRNENSTATSVFGSGNISSHPVTVLADGISTDTSIEGLMIYGQDATNGLNSYGIYVKNSTGVLTMRNNIIRSGDGGNGPNGTPGMFGLDGVDGQGRTDGSAYDAFETAGPGTCNSANDRQYSNEGSRTVGSDNISGGRGGGNACSPSFDTETSGTDGWNGQSGEGPLGGAGGPGGDAGDDGKMTDGSCYLPGSPMTGTDGEPGLDGYDGTGGNGTSLNQGSITAGHWTGYNGENGTQGGNGGGGGGGGAGGGGEYISGVTNPYDRLGGHGGGGGSGAGGGTGGEAGQAGGGSFGIFIIDSTAPIIESTAIYRGKGGTGGNGGTGGAGGAGGDGGEGGQCPGSCWCFKGAGSGGNGGDGGHGGGGGGACGGISVGIYTSNINGLPNYDGGPANNVITGGAGGQKGFGGISLGDYGDDGVVGYLADVIYN